MAFEPPAVRPTYIRDYRVPAVATEADIPAFLDWLRVQPEYKGGRVVGVLLQTRDTGALYRVTSQPALGTPGTLETYGLDRTPSGASILAAAEALLEGAEGFEALASQLPPALAEVDTALASLDTLQAQLFSTANAKPYANLAAFPAANLNNGTGAIALDTGAVYKSNGSTWGSPIGYVAAPSFVQALTPNMLPDGINPSVYGAGLRPYFGSAYSVPVVNAVGTGPFGFRSISTPEASYIALTTFPEYIPLPPGGAGLDVYVYAKTAAGHANRITVTPLLADGTTGAQDGANFSVGNMTAVAGFAVTRWQKRIAWPANTIGFRVDVTLNSTKVAGVSELGGVWITPAGGTLPSQLAAPVVDRPAARLSEADIAGWMAQGSGYPVPTEATPFASWVYDIGQIVVIGDVMAYYATNNLAYLQRSIPYIDALFAIRDDRRSTPRADFTGTVRKAWGTDNFQPSIDGDMYSSRNITGTPPHPGVYIHFPLHAALQLWPILSWIEAVRSTQNVPAALITVANGYLTLALETLHEFDGQYATSTHETNTDPGNALPGVPAALQAGEGRYFMKYSKAATGVLREGYSYIPGGVEMPTNMDCQVMAALCVAYRLTRGTGTVLGAEAQGFKDKAEGIAKRIKRSLYVMDGFTGWHYTRRGTWNNTVWTTSTPANNPYLLQFSGYSNPTANVVGYGEDWDHTSITLRGIREFRQTFGTVFTHEDITGMARTVMSAYWAHSRFQRRYFLPSPELLWSASGSVNHVVGSPTAELTWWAAYDNRLRGALLDWYRRGLINRQYMTGFFRVNGLL